MNQYDPVFDIKVDVGGFDLYFMVQWMYEHHTLGLWVNMIWHLTSN